MTIQDTINAFYEFGAGFAILLSVIKLHKDKEVKGVHWFPIFFFTTWGFWNLYYYAHLNQTASWFAGISVVTVNTIWFLQIIYYVFLKKLKVYEESE